MTIVGIVLLIGLIALLLIPQKESSLQFEPLEPQLSLLDKTHKTWFGDKMVLDGENAKRTMCDWFYYKSVVASPNADTIDFDKKIENAKKQLEADLNGLITEYNFSAIYWIAEEAFDMLAGLYQNLPNSKQNIISLCEDYTPELAASIDDEINAFKQIDVEEHLSGSDNRFTPRSIEIARLLHRHLWFAAVSEFYSASSFESPEERVTFLRWQIECSSMPVQNKIEKLERLESTNINYDIPFAKAVLFAQNQRPDLACQTLKTAIETNALNNDFRKNRYINSLNEIRQAHSVACP